MNLKLILRKIIIAIGIASISSGCRPVLFPVNISLPVDLSRDGSTSDQEINLLFDDNYEIELQFHSSTNWAPGDKKLINYLGGESGNLSGVVIPVQIIIVKINDKNKKIIIDKLFKTKGISGIGEKSIIRKISAVQLNSGIYHVKIINKNNNVELSDVNARLVIHYFRR